MARLLLLIAALLLAPACGSGAGGAPGSGPPVEPDPPARRISAYETALPYLDAGPEAFWARPDLYVMQPDVEPLDLWPDEVMFPATHGVRIIVMLPGDYRGRSNGRLPPGVLMVEESGTAEAPVLVIFAPEVGVDLREVAHPAERFDGPEARLGALRVFVQSHQVFSGLTFRDGFSASLLWQALDCTLDGCLWHETAGQPLRIRFGSQRNRVQRCVMQRFDRDAWGTGDTVAIQLVDGPCTHNQVVSNVILNYTDAYQHTDREGDPYGLGAGTILDNNVMGFTPEAYVQTAEGELMCGENAIDLKMGGTPEEPVRVTNNVFFGVRAAQAGCAATGSGGYAITPQRLGTWVEITDNRFLDVDAGVFLNAFFLDADPAKERIDPHLTIARNLFSDVSSHASAFPSRTGHVLTGSSPATFLENDIVLCDRLMEQEPVGSGFELVIRDNVIHGPLVLDPRDRPALASDGNTFLDGPTTPRTFHVPWTTLTIDYEASR